MKNLRNMLFASLLALAISSTAFASNSNINTGAANTSNINTGAANTSNINTGAANTSNINTGLADLLGDIVEMFMGLV